MDLTRFKYNERAGVVTDQDGEPQGTLINGAVVIDVDGVLVTAAQIAWTLYHGPVAENLRVVPVDAKLPLRMPNLKTVSEDSVKMAFELPGYMNVDQSVLSTDDNNVDGGEVFVVEAEEEAVVSDEPVQVEEPAVAEKAVTLDTPVERMPSGKWRAYAIVNGKIESVGEFRRKKDATRCSEFHTNKPDA